MDRFAWLNAQKRWIHSWHGCLKCTACQEDRIIFCDKIKWLFQGFASFHVNLGVRSDSDSSAQHISCPLEAAHLFFATHSTLSDPAQLALRLGLLMEESEEIEAISISDIRGREKLMLTFDSSNLFILEILQVESISFWHRNSTCSACQLQEVISTELSNRIQACGCQQLPSHIIVNLQHVTLNVYADEHCNERFRNTMSLTEVMEVLEKILLEQKQMSLIDNNARLADTNCIEQVELPAEAKDVLKYTHMILQRYLNDVDCISECAMKAVEVCSGDLPWMGRMLLIMAEHAAYQSLDVHQLQTLKGVLHCRLEESMEKEKLEMEKAWGANSRQLIQQQQMQDLPTSSIRHSKQQRKCIEAALLWVEVLCAGLNL